MKYIKQLFLILAASFLGEALNYLIPLPIPAGIYGIAVLFALLQARLLPLSAVEETGDFLIEIMPLMFIPAAVGLLDSWGVIKASALKYLAICAVSTVIVMGVSGAVTQAIIRHGRNNGGIS